MDDFFSSTNKNLDVRAQYFPEDIIAPDEPYKSPERTATVATQRQRDYQESADYVNNLAIAQSKSPVMKALRQAVGNTDRAVSLMSGIGYMNFRHMQAAGFTLHEIAEEISLNVLDLMAYMSSHPEAETHAILDMDCCADAKMANLITQLKTAPMRTKYEADKLKQLVYATELLVKRLSAKWVGQFRATTTDSDGNVLAGATGLTINMNIGQLNSTTNNQNNYSPAQQEAAVQLQAYNDSIDQSAKATSALIDLDMA